MNRARPFRWNNTRLAVAAAFLVVSGGSCVDESSPGIPPPPDRFAFPSGLSLDPRVDASPALSCQSSSDCGPDFTCVHSACRQASRHLFVVNANSDRQYHSGTIVPIDLDRFFASSGVLDKSSPDPSSATILESGATLSPEFPCRRVHITPQVIECEESYFSLSDATVNIGNFGANPESYVPSNANLENVPVGQSTGMLMVPVRGDPSITWMEISGGYGEGPLRLECGQSNLADKPRDCAKKYRLSHLFGDLNGTRIETEPFEISVSNVKGRPMAFVSHLQSEKMTLISLEGVDTGSGSTSGSPQIIDSSTVFAFRSFSSGYGIAERPCVLSNPQEIPASTQNCTRPLLYTAFRNESRIGTVTAIGPDLETLDNWQRCVDPQEVGNVLGGIDCNAKVKVLSSFTAPGLPVIARQGETPLVLASIEFGSDGTQLYAVQSRPGGLIRIDTRVDPRTREPVNSANTVLEVCSDPAEFVVYRDATADFGVVSCYRSAEIFIVDLASMLVVKILRAGTGAHEMLVDPAREVIYVANFLESTVSVIDMSRERQTRFSEIARIGLQETFLQ